MLSDSQVKQLQKKIEPDQLELQLCDTFRLLGDWNRFRIMKTLLEAKELCVSDIAKVLGISMSATSQHLRILELSGLVISERMGQTICYMPSSKHVIAKPILRLIK